MGISYFNDSHFTWQVQYVSFSRLKITFWISVFISSTKLEFEIKELLNFQRPRSLEILLKFRKEQNNREWSVDRTSSILAFLVNSCILFEINKSSSLLYKIPVKWRCWNVLDLGFLNWHVSHKLGDSIYVLLFYLRLIWVSTSRY